jgi:hypothetical protein
MTEWLHETEERARRMRGERPLSELVAELQRRVEQLEADAAVLKVSVYMTATWSEHAALTMASHNEHKERVGYDPLGR